MKKKLFTLLLCAFACISVNAAAYIGDGGTTLYINGSSEATPLTDFSKIQALQGYQESVTITKIVLTGDFSSGWGGSWLINGGENDPSAVEIIDMSGVTSLGPDWGFTNFNNLEEIKWPANNCITTIPQFAFKNCSIKTLTIPTSVEYIEKTAFDMNGLETLIIPEGSNLKIIRSQAFNNCKGLKDVYIYATPTTGSGTDETWSWGNPRNIPYFPYCEEQAFPYDVTVVQTAEQGISGLATLHFDEAYFDFFCGNWKKGLTFIQSNLNGIKDGLDVDGDNQNDGPMNGWQQFAMTGSPTEIVVPVKNEIVRTWSADNAYVIPKFAYKDPTNGTQKVVDIFNCYMATGYTYNANGSSVELTKLKQVMPANTGMILRSTDEYTSATSSLGDDQKEVNLLVFMVEATGDKYDLTEYVHGVSTQYSDGTTTKNVTNYLETSIDETPIGPVTLENGKVAYRNFGLYGGDGSYQFVRYKKGTIRANRAYLKLTTTQFPNNNESATGGPGSGLDNGTGDAKIFLVFEDADEQAGETTGISVVNTKQVDNTYYNLQGMKVENPSKGIYIYNGKKVIK